MPKILMSYEIRGQEGLEKTLNGARNFVRSGNIDSICSMGVPINKGKSYEVNLDEQSGLGIDNMERAFGVFVEVAGMPDRIKYGSDMYITEMVVNGFGKTLEKIGWWFPDRRIVDKD